MDIVESCAVCSARECIFCHLSAGDLTELGAIRQRRVVMTGAALFTEGHSSQSVFVLCSGRIKLTTSSASGRTLILGIAGPGAVLGLGAVISNGVYDVSARATELTQYSFIPRQEFLDFLNGRADVWVRVAEQLAAEVRRAIRQISRIALASTAGAKLASFLIEWIASDASPGAARVSLPLTHEEIGELVGCSRETVARVFGQFRRQGLIHVRGRFVSVPDRRRLEAIANNISPPRLSSRPLTLAAR